MKTKKYKLDIFTQNILPTKNYIIKGDRNPEHEIKPLYLMKMSSKYNVSPKNRRTAYFQ